MQSHHQSSPLHFRRSMAAVFVTALIAGLGVVLGAASPAHAEPVTITDPNSGASITLSSSVIAPGERVNISGTGFVAASGSTGETLVAVRPYDYDTNPAWTMGGEDAYIPPNPTLPPGSEAKHWFITDHTDNGSFEGWIQAPATMTKEGPYGTGNHWLRILSGAFFTTTGDRLTAPITFNVPFTFGERLQTGLTGPTGTYQEGSIFRPGAQLTLTGRGYDPSSAVTVSLDGTPLATSITTTAEGQLPSSARANLPVDVTAGTHTLTVATGANTASKQITVTAPPTATVPTTVVRPGGTIAYDLAGYIGVSGQPQKVAVVVQEAVLKCIQADATGTASGAVTLPTSISESVLVRFNVGLSCVLPPAGVVNDQPVSSTPQTITVSDTAPQVSVPDASYASGSVEVSGSGFTPGAAVAVTAGDEPAATLIADAAGAISGAVPAPAQPGDYRLLAADGTNTAAAVLPVVAKRTSAVTLSAPGPLVYGAARKTTVRLTFDGEPAAGSVLIRQGGWSKTVDVAIGGTTVQLPRDAKVAKHTVTARFDGDDTAGAADASSSFTVTKAKATASIKPAKKQVRKSKGLQVTLRVTINGAPKSIAATGKVTVYDGAKKLQTYTLKASHKGVLKVKLPKFGKLGNHKLKIGYAGSVNVKSTTSKVVTIKVV